MVAHLVETSGTFDAVGAVVHNFTDECEILHHFVEFLMQQDPDILCYKLLCLRIAEVPVFGQDKRQPLSKSLKSNVATVSFTGQVYVDSCTILKRGGFKFIQIG
jgi:hypothetical protein